MRAAPDGAWERFSAALDDDFNTPAALAVMHEWRDHELLRRALEVFGLGSLAQDDEVPQEVSGARRATPGGAGSAGLRRGRSAARRSSRRAGWEVRDEPDGHRLVRLR